MKLEDPSAADGPSPSGDKGVSYKSDAGGPVDGEPPSESVEKGHAGAVTSELDHRDHIDGEPPVADAPDTGTRGDADFIRPDVAAEHPELYERTNAPLPPIDGSHQSPEEWSDAVNPARQIDMDKGDHNCGECARAVQETWEGNPRVAGTETQLTHLQRGEPVEIMQAWAGAELQPTSVEDIRGRLDELGAGSSAIVQCGWPEGGGHYFNAVNDGGTVKAVDGQIGASGAWPPNRTEFPYDPGEMRNVQAIIFDASGRTVR